MLADKLNMTPEDAERWIVNLIRNARLDAKIDSKLVSLQCYMFGKSILIPTHKINQVENANWHPHSSSTLTQRNLRHP